MDKPYSIPPGDYIHIHERYAGTTKHRIDARSVRLVKVVLLRKGTKQLRETVQVIGLWACLPKPDETSLALSVDVSHQGDLMIPLCN